MQTNNRRLASCFARILYLILDISFSIPTTSQGKLASSQAIRNPPPCFTGMRWVARSYWWVVLSGRGTPKATGISPAVAGVVSLAPGAAIRARQSTRKSNSSHKYGNEVRISVCHSPTVLSNLPTTRYRRFPDHPTGADCDSGPTHLSSGFRAKTGFTTAVAGLAISFDRRRTGLRRLRGRAQDCSREPDS